MTRICNAVRFLFGLAMVAGGVSLAAPMVVAVVRQCVRQAAPAPVAAAVGPVVDDAAAPAGVAPSAPPSGGWPPAVDAGFDSGAVVLDPHYQPPPPPGPLPAVSGEIRGGAPEVAATYRSMLDAPPPSLLDAHGPPPLAAGWTPRAVPPSLPAALPAAVVPQTYVIRDGDDLTGIATRFYGHAAAATAIWSANRDTIPDPNVLPIGAVVRLPPAWTMVASPGDDPRAIEPRPGVALPLPGGGGLPPEAAAPATRPVGWLAGDGRPLAPVAAAAPRPAAVRLAPGETLASLARRFYGDERMADRIWEVNRDRLRSPQLVVAGMELRLP